MKLVVIMNGDGHFQLSKLENKRETLSLLRNIEYGDFWTNESEDIMDDYGISTDAEILTLTDEVFEEFCHNFEQRGSMEIIEI